VAGELTRHQFPFDVDVLPANGVYLLFEKGEPGHGGDRIVRIGSHTGVGNLAQRLTEHFIREKKDRSIFRKNVGRALLSREGDPFLEQWDWDLTSRANREKYGRLVNRHKLFSVERRVTQFIIENCTFVVLPTSPHVAPRLALEAGLIATVAQCRYCHPSPGWLGRFSPKPVISRTGLWQKQHVNGEPLSSFRRADT